VDVVLQPRPPKRDLGSIHTKAAIGHGCVTFLLLTPLQKGTITQQLGYLSLIMSGYQGGVNLMSFSLAEVFVFHGQLRLPGQEALNAIHPQPPIHQLIKVTLRA